jgi:uncharacterized Fe-S cluster-containing radical SAM superfamily protein
MDPSAHTDPDLLMSLLLPTISAEALRRPEPFVDPFVTAKGEVRASVSFSGYKTLWFNTGTLCNVACKGCYIESSPKNDALSYLSLTEAICFLNEATRLHDVPELIGFTGGEPFLNPHFIGMLSAALERQFHVLILTNAMRPLQLKQDQLAALNHKYAGRISIRVSLDHFTKEGHERIRGPRTWTPTMAGIDWLFSQGFRVSLAGRLPSLDHEAALRRSYGELFHARGWPLNPLDPIQLVLFPDITDTRPVPEISEGCWSKVSVKPAQLMCANSRMVVRRRGEASASVVACTLIAHDPAFDLGVTLQEAKRDVWLKHRSCARFCVLGGSNCAAQAKSPAKSEHV